MFAGIGAVVLFLYLSRRDSRRASYHRGPRSFEPECVFPHWSLEEYGYTDIEPFVDVDYPPLENMTYGEFVERSMIGERNAQGPNRRAAEADLQLRYFNGSLEQLHCPWIAAERKLRERNVRRELVAWEKKWRAWKPVREWWAQVCAWQPPSVNWSTVATTMLRFHN